MGAARSAPALVAALALLGVATGAAAARGGDRAVLMLNWYTYGEHAPFYLGVETGLYAKEGIDLEIQEGRGSGVTVQAVAAGSATFGYADFATMIKAAAQGAPVEAVGVLLKRSPMSVMGFAERGVEGPKDIVGKTVAVTPGDSLSQLWPVFLKKNGLEPGQFKTVAGDAMTKRNAVVSGRADLLLGNVNDQLPIIEEATGRKMRALLFADYGVSPLNAGIVVRKALLEQSPDLVRRFLRASVAAVEATVRSPDRAVAAILARNPRAGRRETLKRSLELTLPLYHRRPEAGGPPFRAAAADVADTLDLMVRYGGVDPGRRGRPEDYYTNEFLP